MKNILIIGESCTDIFEYGSCTRLNPEAPSPVFESSRVVKSHGMASNVLNNMKSIIDENSIQVCSEISDPDLIIKHRFVDQQSNYILLRVDKDGPISKIDLTNDKLLDKIRSADAVIVSDYNKGFLSESDLVEISKLAKLSFIDTKKPIGSWINRFSYVKINKKEFENPANDLETLSLISNRLIVTLGENGARLEQVLVPPTTKIKVKDVSGAGDTFLAALVIKYLESNSIFKAIHYANHCSAIAVSNSGVVAVGHLI